MLELTAPSPLELVAGGTNARISATAAAACARMAPVRGRYPAGSWPDDVPAVCPVVVTWLMRLAIATRLADVLRVRLAAAYVTVVSGYPAPVTFAGSICSTAGTDVAASAVKASVNPARLGATNYWLFGTCSAAVSSPYLEAEGESVITIMNFDPGICAPLETQSPISPAWLILVGSQVDLDFGSARKA